MDIPPIVGKSTDSDITPFKESAPSLQDDRLTKVVNDALHAAWNVSPEKKLKVDGYVRHIFDEATRSLMQDISQMLRERFPEEKNRVNLACEELGRIASQKAAAEGLLLHGLFSEFKDNKSQYKLIQLLLLTDLVGELGLQLDDNKCTKINEAFDWAIAVVEGKEGVSPDPQILNDATLLGEESLVELLGAGYPLAVKV